VGSLHVLAFVVIGMGDDAPSPYAAMLSQLHELKNEAAKLQTTHSVLLQQNQSVCM